MCLCDCRGRSYLCVCVITEADRTYLHKQLVLLEDRPLFRRGCAHVFLEDTAPNSPLTNVHEGLMSSGESHTEMQLQGTLCHFYIM